MLYDTDMGALEGLACVSGDLDKDAVTTGMTSEVQQLITDPLREFKIWNMVRSSNEFMHGSESRTPASILPASRLPN